MKEEAETPNLPKTQGGSHVGCLAVEEGAAASYGLGSLGVDRIKPFRGKGKKGQESAASKKAKGVKKGGAAKVVRPRRLTAAELSALVSHTLRST
jgi:hypothetical protein